MTNKRQKEIRHTRGPLPGIQAGSKTERNNTSGFPIKDFGNDEQETKRDLSYPGTVAGYPGRK